MKPLKAVILAGGKGERLRPYTQNRPKPMVEIEGKPILEHQLCWLLSHGVSEAILCCGYLWEVIHDHFQEGQKFGLKLHYCIEEAPLGRGGAIKQAIRQFVCEDKTFIALNGDNLTDLPLDKMIKAHQTSDALATVLMVPLRSPYGIIDLGRENQIKGFLEKPVLPHWINAGIYVLSRDIYSHLPETGDHETETFPKIAQIGKLYGFKHQGFWRTVDTVKDLTEVAQEIAQKNVHE